jgi:hypothetical protein
MAGQEQTSGKHQSGITVLIRVLAFFLGFIALLVLLRLLIP